MHLLFKASAEENVQGNLCVVLSSLFKTGFCVALEGNVKCRHLEPTLQT